MQNLKLITVMHAKIWPNRTIEIKIREDQGLMTVAGLILANRWRCYRSSGGKAMDKTKICVLCDNPTVRIYDLCISFRDVSSTVKKK